MNMGMRFRRSVKIAPGVRWNVGMKSSSFSIGPRGCTYNVSTKGNRSKNASSLQSNSSIKQVNAELNLGVFPDGELAIKERNGELNKIDPKVMKLIRGQQHAKVEEWLYAVCKQENEELESIRYIHLRTPNPNLRREFEALPFTTACPTQPILKKIGFWGHIIKKHKKRIEQDNIAKKTEYEKTLKEWEMAKAEHDKRQLDRERLFIEREDNINAIEFFLSEYLPSLNWPRETNVSFDILDDGNTIMLDVDLPEVEDMPSREASVISRSLKINYKDITDTNRRRDYMSHVHGVGFLLIGEVFSFLPKLDKIILSGYSQRIDRSSGATQDEYLYSVVINRSQWIQINFTDLRKVDPVESLSKFEIRRKMTKTGIFSPIEPFALSTENVS